MALTRITLGPRNPDVETSVKCTRLRCLLNRVYHSNEFSSGCPLIPQLARCIIIDRIPISFPASFGALFTIFGSTSHDLYTHTHTHTHHVPLLLTLAKHFVNRQFKNIHLFILGYNFVTEGIERVFKKSKEIWNVLCTVLMLYFVLDYTCALVILIRSLRRDSKYWILHEAVWGWDIEVWLKPVF